MRRAFGTCGIFGALILTVASWGNAATSALIPSPLQGIVVSVMVGRDNRGIFTYQYRVINPPANDGQISMLDIDITRNPDEVALPREGLINGPRYWRQLSEDAFKQVPMVPVGINGPDGWIYGLGFDAGRTPLRGFVGWGAADEHAFIRPGSRLASFELTSYGLPGIRDFVAHPDVDYSNLPYPEFHDVAKVRQLKESLAFRGKTVGQRAPAQEFVSLEFLNYLITLVYDSRQLGWIKVDGVRQSLLAKLTNAKRKLEAGDTTVSKNMLDAFLHEVQATSCPEFTCPGDKPLTSEAYALLFFNDRYLLERLPAH